MYSWTRNTVHTGEKRFACYLKLSLMNALVNKYLKKRQLNTISTSRRGTRISVNLQIQVCMPSAVSRPAL